MEHKVPQVRVVKKTYYTKNGKRHSSWYEVQYYSEKSEMWRSYRQYQNIIKFNDKAEAIEFSLIKKAGGVSNGTVTEVVA